MFIRQTVVIVIIAVLITLGGYGNRTQAQKLEDSSQVTEIHSVLDAQVAAWNRGDIEGFMAGYANSPDTTFVSGDTVTHGWQTVLDRYKKNYNSRDKMGSLEFSDLEITMLDKTTAVADGRWKLTRGGDTPHGRFTLVLRRSKGGWRIVHDHTTSLTS